MRGLDSFGERIVVSIVYRARKREQVLRLRLGMTVMKGIRLGKGHLYGTFCGTVEEAAERLYKGIVSPTEVGSGLVK